MNDYSTKSLSTFFDAVASWRSAYTFARLIYVAVERGDQFAIVFGRLVLGFGSPPSTKPLFAAGSIQAGEWDIPQSPNSIEDAIAALMSSKGLDVSGHGVLLLPTEQNREVSASPPTLLHPEGLTNGNRVAVITITGADRYPYVPQPDTDWMLKAASTPYDTLDELMFEYGLGGYRGNVTAFEVAALTPIQVLAQSAISGTSAAIGVWMARGLDKTKARIGYRVFDKGVVVQRNSIDGPDLAWKEEDQNGLTGTATVNVPPGAVVQCIAAYDQHAHQVSWRADPTIFQNPRLSLLSLVDQGGQLVREYLAPDQPAKSRAADDFETAIGWVLWALGFAPVTFGLNAKTRDAFDSVAVTPKGDFVVVECTLGLLKSESKLAKLHARVANLRKLLDNSNMRHLRILPLIVTALTREQVKADQAQADSLGILVATRENLEQAVVETLKYPNADALFDRGMQILESTQAIGSFLLPQHPT